MDCPNDRYVNDEAICQAVAAMLARIGVKVTLNALPKAKYFEKAGPTDKYDSSFNLLGWTPGSFDSWNVLSNIIGCRDAERQGRHLQLRRLLQSEDRRADQADPGRDRHRQARRHDRRGLPISARGGGHDPLHQQALVWGVSQEDRRWCSAPTTRSCFYWVQMQIERGYVRLAASRCGTRHARQDGHGDHRTATDALGRTRGSRSADHALCQARF